jgi:hypothetical protein
MTPHSAVAEGEPQLSEPPAVRKAGRAGNLKGTARIGSMMRPLLGLLAYLAAMVAIVSGAAAVLSSTSDPSASKASARPEPTTIASPRIQAWLDRKAEGVAYAERERAAAQADREKADELSAKLAATPQPYVAPRAQEARAQATEERRDAERERAARAKEAERERVARAKERAKREARRRQRDLEAPTTYSYAAEPQRAPYTDDFLTRRDRYGY